MAESVGQIGLDLVLNSAGFKRQLNSINATAKNASDKISSSFKKIATTAVAAFSVKKIADFGKECQLLANAQIEAETKLKNIMKQRMKATDSSIRGVEQLTSAQQKLGVVGDEVQLAGAQQLATFLNTNTALEKLIPAMNNLAVQQNGVNVTAESMTNIGNMMGKVMQGQTSALTRVGITFTDAQEKMLKYGNEEQRAATLAQVITDNVGNMNKAIASTPAGKMQQIKNSFGDIQETLGRAINNVFAPMLSYISKIVSGLETASKKFESFTKTLFGDSNNNSANNLSQAASSAEDMTNEVDNASASLETANKSAKKLKNNLAGFDKLNVISKQTSSASNTNPNPNSGNLNSKVIMDTKDLDKANNKVNKLKKNIDLVVKTFKSGFWKGFAKIDFKPLQKNLKSIGDTLNNIFTNKNVQKSAKKCAKALVENLGVVVGSAFSIGVNWATSFSSGISRQLKKSKNQITNFLSNTFGTWEIIFNDIGDISLAFKKIFTDSEVLNAVDGLGESWCNLIISKTEAYISVGTTIAYNIVEGVKKYLIQNSEILKDRLVSMLDISSRIDDITAGFYDALSEIFSAFRSEDATQCTSDFIGIFANGVTGALEVLGKFGSDIYDTIITPITENATKIKNTLKGLFKPLSKTLKTIKKSIDKTFEHFNKVYDEKIAPAFEEIKEGFSSTIGVLLDNWNKYIQPVLDKLSDKFAAVWNSEIQPAIDSVSDSIGKVFDKIKKIFNLVKPVVDELIKVISPFISALVSALGTKLMSSIKGLFKTISSIIKTILNAGSIFVDLFTFDFDGLKEDLGSLFESVKGIFSGVFDAVTAPLDGIVEFFETLWDNIKGVFSPVTEWFSNIFSSAKNGICNVFSSIGEWFSEKWQAIKDVFAPVGNFFKTAFGNAWTLVKNVWKVAKFFFSTVWKKIKKVFDPVANWFKNTFSSAWGKVKSVFSNVGTWFKNTFSSAWEGIKDVFSNVGSFFGGIWKTIKKKFTSIGTKIGDAVGGAFKKAINTVLSTVEKVINAPIKAINKLLGVINEVPGIELDKLSEFKLPRLAKGGLVKAPTLALVGDNKGASTGNPEVVAPLNKLQGMINSSTNPTDTAIITEILSVLKKIYELFLLFRRQGGSSYEFVAKLSGSVLFDEIVKQDRIYRKCHGGKSAFS